MKASNGKRVKLRSIGRQTSNCEIILACRGSQKNSIPFPCQTNHDRIGVEERERERARALKCKIDLKFSTF